MTDVPLIGRAEAPDLHVMTYNIRRLMPPMIRRRRDIWARRRGLLRSILQTEQPTVLGIQEGLADQVEFVAHALGPHYAGVGRGRDARGRGERCTIFYDTRRLRLEDWQQRALSDTPLRPGSRSWGNMVPRIVVTAAFTDIATGIGFTVVNSHFDHISRVSRSRSAAVVNELVLAAAGPAIAMGDFNAGLGSPAVRILTSGPLRDAWTLARAHLTPLWGTYSGYRRPRVGGKRIDWLLVTGTISVESAGINAVRLDGAAGSDHEPVQAVVRLQPAAPPAGRLS